MQTAHSEEWRPGFAKRAENFSAVCAQAENWRWSPGETIARVAAAVLKGTPIHANSAHEALSRLEDLIGEVTQRIPHRAIAAAINIVVFIERTREGRRVRSVSTVRGWGPDGYNLED